MLSLVTLIRHLGKLGWLQLRMPSKRKSVSGGCGSSGQASNVFSVVYPRE